MSWLIPPKHSSRLIFLLLLFWQLKFPNEKSFLKLFWSNILGRVSHENARGWINSRKENRENIPTDGQKSWWEIVFRRIYRGKIRFRFKNPILLNVEPRVQGMIHPSWDCSSVILSAKLHQANQTISSSNNVPCTTTRLLDYQYCNIGHLLSWSIKIKNFVILYMVDFFVFLLIKCKIQRLPSESNRNYVDIIMKIHHS